MKSKVLSNERVLGLFFELLNAERGRSRAQIRALPGYRDLNDDAFEVQFDRDKDALRSIGLVLEITPNGRYQVNPTSFAATLNGISDVDIALMHLAASAWQGLDQRLLTPKLAATTDAELSSGQPVTMALEGHEVVASLASAIAGTVGVSFEYAALSGSAVRKVCPWRLVLRGNALYLWGYDLDREAPRLYRLSRIRGAVEHTGHCSVPVPTDVSDPFADLMVAPRLRVRGAAAKALYPYLTFDNDPTADDWQMATGTEAEEGQWISRVLRYVEDAVVLGPDSLREKILAKLAAAAGGQDA